jgi:hypothetical protein
MSLLFFPNIMLGANQQACALCNNKFICIHQIHAHFKRFTWEPMLEIACGIFGFLLCLKNFLYFVRQLCNK